MRCRRGRVVGASAREVPAVTWSLITAPDERERCCVVESGKRCPERTAYRVAAASGELDDYTHCCERHLELVSGPGYVATMVSGVP
jgi:hypothetical protein